MFSNDESTEEKKNVSSIKCLKLAEKTIYGFILSILILTLLVQVFKCLMYYMKQPTYIETKITPQHKALFPAMTICPQNNGYNEEKLKVLFDILGRLL